MTLITIELPRVNLPLRLGLAEEVGLRKRSVPIHCHKLDRGIWHQMTLAKLCRHE